MGETPIIDAAIRAGCAEAKVGCVYPGCAKSAFKCRPAEIIKIALRAALPWPDGERMPLVGPLMRELYPEKFE
jgi:hypothetical protein